MRWSLLYLAALPVMTALALDSTHHTLPNVTVTATCQPVAAPLTPFRSQVIRAASLREMGSETVADALTQHSELYVRRYSSGLATLSQRGQLSSSTLILLDGHRIASPSLGLIDLSLLPSLILSAIEITAGPGSSSYGRDALGGVVHLQIGLGDTLQNVSPLRLRMSSGSLREAGDEPDSVTPLGVRCRDAGCRI